MAETISEKNKQTYRYQLAWNTFIIIAQTDLLALYLKKDSLFTLNRTCVYV